MSKLATLSRIGRNANAAFALAWSRLWFQSSPTTPLEIMRIGIGAALLVHYALLSPQLFLFWGNNGFVPLDLAYQNADDVWTQSAFFYLWAPWQWVALHGLFLLGCCAFVLGWHTAWAKWVVLIGQISYASRNPLIVDGIDNILSALLLILCLAPIGKALSLDRVRAVRTAKLATLETTLPRHASPWAGACIRLIQIQMAVLLFCSAFHRIPDNAWWSGDAVWLALTQYDYYNGFLLDLFASHYWLGNVATYSIVMIEFAYPFLIWQRRTRPYMLATALFMHLQVGVLMGQLYFFVVMAMGHMSFLRPEWLARLGAWWKRRIGEMEMVYDGICGFCVRSMAWFLSFDGLTQISIRDFRRNPSPVVSDALVEKALYLVLPDGRALPGFEAYRHVVLRVPGLWWMVPLFYIPVVSRLVGHPIYNWVASNRSWLSSFRQNAAARG